MPVGLWVAMSVLPRTNESTTPYYRQLEKKQGYKGKVKVNKGVARKWYV